MLVPVQTSGNKAPLFFVHGLHGVMPLGPTFAEVLGPDQPIYAIHANGVDGRKPVTDTMPDMVLDYVADIEEARPTGPLVVGGMCEGSHAAIEIARALQAKGRQVGPVILADPTPMPTGYVKEYQQSNPRHPLIAAQLYNQARKYVLQHASRPTNDIPFDSRDPKQLHLAVAAGVGSMIALGKHVPVPFSGPVELIVSARRAIGFFHPQMPWHKLLLGPRITHVLPWTHDELFLSGRETVARLIELLLEEAPTLQKLAAGDMELAVA